MTGAACGDARKIYAKISISSQAPGKIIFINLNMVVQRFKSAHRRRKAGGVRLMPEFERRTGGAAMEYSWKLSDDDDWGNDDWDNDDDNQDDDNNKDDDY